MLGEQSCYLCGEDSSAELGPLVLAGCGCRVLSHSHCRVRAAIQIRMTRGDEKYLKCCEICNLKFEGRTRSLLVEQWFNRVRHLPEENEERLMAQMDVAMDLKLRGHFEKALSLAKNCFCNVQKHKGFHCSRMWTMGLQLAGCYDAAGKQHEAQNLREKMITEQRMSLGEGHPDVIMNSAFAAKTYQSQHKYEDAMKVYRRIEDWHICKGNTHSVVYVNLKRQMSKILAYMKRFDESTKANSAASDIGRKLVGENHELTMKTDSDRALILHLQGDDKQALAIWEAVWRKSVELSGKESLHTLQRQLEYALSMEHNLRKREAADVRLQILKSSRAQFGCSHPFTVQCLETVAWSLAKEDNMQGHQRVLRLVLEKKMHAFGNEHRQTLKSRLHLAHVLGSTKTGLDEALELARNVRDINAERGDGQFLQGFDVKAFVERLECKTFAVNEDLGSRKRKHS